MGELKDYFDNRTILSLKEQYGSSFGQVLIETYKTLIYWVEIERATKFLIRKNEGEILWRGDEIIRDSQKQTTEWLERTKNKEMRADIITGSNHALLSSIQIIPLVIHKDEMIQKYARIIKESEEELIIEFVYPNEG